MDIQLQTVKSPALLTTDAAALFLGVTSRRLLDWRAKRIGPDYHRVGRSVRYAIPELKKWLAANRVRPETNVAASE
jgi:hypothetical protein